MEKEIGGRGKSVLEPKERTPIEDFLYGKVSSPVKIAYASKNGHNFSKTWIGEEINSIEIDMQKIIESRKTGCCIITDGSVSRTIFVDSGLIVKHVDDRQLTMKI